VFPLKENDILNYYFGKFCPQMVGEIFICSYDMRISNVS
jgi:hypothetical protein